MRSRIASLALLYVKSTFSISLPSREELKKPKTLIKTLGIGLGILFLVADFSFIFVMMNLTMYDGLKSAGLQELMLLNAATTASVLVFVLAFMLALSMFSMSGIESGFLVLPFSSRELLAAKMVLVYLTEALAGVFILAIAMVIYGIKEGQPIMFYVNGLVTAFALPLLPTAISYLILLPLMNASKLFRNKNFILYIGGFLGMGFALAFNFYIQSAMARIGDPASISLFANPDSFISKLGRAWIPSWLAWKALSDASTFGGALAVLGNLAIGLAGFALTVFLFGGVYVRTLRAFNESTFSRKKLLGIGAARGSGRAAGRIFARKSVMRSLVVREIRLMNREPMYLLNGPFVVILMPVLIAIVFIAQRGTMVEVVAGITSLLSGPGGYLVPAALGAFLGSATSIACTAVSRDAKAI
ncbi:MAG: putative ABC transporter permease subunit, partial [Spirochaetales bacterium]